MANDQWFYEKYFALRLSLSNHKSLTWDSVHWGWCWLVSVLVIAFNWSGVVVVVGQLGCVDQGVGGLTGKGALDGSEVLGFFVLNFRGVDWDSVDWSWGVSVS